VNQSGGFLPSRPAVPVHLTAAAAFPGGRQRWWGGGAQAVQLHVLHPSRCSRLLQLELEGLWELPGLSLQRHESMQDCTQSQLGSLRRTGGGGGGCTYTQCIAHPVPSPSFLFAMLNARLRLNRDGRRNSGSERDVDAVRSSRFCHRNFISPRSICVSAFVSTALDNGGREEPEVQSVPTFSVHPKCFYSVS